MQAISLLIHERRTRLLEEAADCDRALAALEQAVRPVQAPKAKAPKAKAEAPRVVSEDTRAKMRAAHQARKAAAAKEALGRGQLEQTDDESFQVGLAGTPAWR
jgi:hypothetical protein